MNQKTRNSIPIICSKGVTVCENRLELLYPVFEDPMFKVRRKAKEDVPFIGGHSIFGKWEARISCGLIMLMI